MTLNDLVIPKHDQLLLDILDHKYNHYILYGGRGGVKSSFISVAIPLLITQNKGVHVVIFRKVANTLRDSVYAQISFGIALLGLSHLFKFTVSPMEITYLPTGQKILFRGVDQPEKIKSIKAPFGYFGITWFEEIDQFHGREEVRTILQSTMRGGEKFWNFESFNPPITTSNWVNKEILTNKRSDRICTQSSYLDVPQHWLSQTFFEEAEHLKISNEKAYRHEYLGEPVGTGGAVFENLVIREIADDEVSQFDRLYFGLDFGWYPDPNHFAICYYNAAQRKLYIFNEIRCNKTSNEKMAKIIETWKKDLIVADSSENKSISDFRTWGFNMRGAEKGPGSVDYSIKWIQSLNEIVIDSKRCPHTATEFLEYEYERDKNGDVITGYPDRNNHAIDAVRYALNYVWKRRGD